jgi:hypothetical protein
MKGRKADASVADEPLRYLQEFAANTHDNSRHFLSPLPTFTDKKFGAVLN